MASSNINPLAILVLDGDSSNELMRLKAPQTGSAVLLELEQRGPGTLMAEDGFTMTTHDTLDAGQYRFYRIGAFAVQHVQWGVAASNPSSEDAINMQAGLLGQRQRSALPQQKLLPMRQHLGGAGLRTSRRQGTDTGA
jgi:hypothetical protein